MGQRDNLGKNSIEISMTQHQKNVKEIHMLLYAAGETLEGPTILAYDFTSGDDVRITIPKYFQEIKENLELKHLCRETIRKHLINSGST